MKKSIVHQYSHIIGVHEQDLFKDIASILQIPKNICQGILKIQVISNVLNKLRCECPLILDSCDEKVLIQWLNASSNGTTI